MQQLSRTANYSLLTKQTQIDSSSLFIVHDGMCVTHAGHTEDERTTHMKHVHKHIRTHYLHPQSSHSPRGSGMNTYTSYTMKATIRI